MIKLIDLPRGDTFQYTALWEGAQLSELKSQVRDSLDNLIAEVKITATDTVGKYHFMVSNTSDWAIGALFTDIQRTANGIIESSESMKINVIRGITQ